MNTQGDCVIRFHAAAGEAAVRDDLNRTVLVVNGVAYGPDPFDMPEVCFGDAVEIRVPTGVLSFSVELFSTDRTLVRSPFHWDGAFNALRGGQSGVATWSINNVADVVTSAWHETVPFDVYARAHDAVDAVHDTASSRVRRTLLHQGIQFVLEIDEIVRIRALAPTMRSSRPATTFHRCSRPRGR